VTPIDHPSKPIFKNLDGIRFVAFLCVFFSHTFYTNDQSLKSSRLFKSALFLAGQWGDLGLSIFFVMSGFLISYLLIHERQTYGKVHVLSFYTRRILRIWPLYFSIVLFNFFVYTLLTHNHDFARNQIPYYFFFANLDVIQHGFNNGIIGHLWAISVEEQFYLTLPLVMVIVPNKYLHFAFIAIIIASQVFRMLHYLESSVLFYHSLSASYEIALGGLAAWLMYFRPKAKNFISELSSGTIIFAYVVFMGMILFQNLLFNPSQLILSIFFYQLFAAFVILEQSYATHSFFKVGRSKWATLFGKYSFGLFCYHILCIRIMEAVVSKLHWNGSFSEVVVIPLLSLTLTLATGIISYHVFEVHFLNLKKKFTYLT
jgi:peptidoglycan/LPS O-acetylase OafA/YrhL